MKYRRILSFILIILGIVFILNYSFRLTGYAVFEDLSRTAGTLIGFFLVLSGLILGMYGHEKERQKKGIDYVISLYESGKIDPVETADRINKLGGGGFVEGVRYSKGKGSVFTKLGRIDLRKLKPSKIMNLALALKEVALINDKKNIVNCYLEGISNKSRKSFGETYKNKLEKMLKS